jgi:hypothetical protein
MTHTRLSWGLLIGVAVLGIVLSGLVWLARQPSWQVRMLILTKGGAPVQGLCTPTGLMRSKASCAPVPEAIAPRTLPCPSHLPLVWITGHWPNAASGVCWKRDRDKGTSAQEIACG